nr:DUF4179 domain-containing protein [Lysinibacillus timonensis]
MNKKVEEQLQSWGKDKEQVPEFFSKGIDDVLNKLPATNSGMEQPKRKKGRFVAKSFVAVAVISFGVIGSGFVSPTMAQVLKEVPIIGSIFSHSSDSSIQIIDEKGLASALNETVTNNGVSLTITEAYFGGGRLALGYMIESDEAVLETIEKTQGIPLHFEALINNQPFTFMAEFEQTVENGVASGIIDMGVGLESNLIDQPMLTLNVNEIGGVEGNWNFEFLLGNTATAEATSGFAPMETLTWDDATFVVERVEFTPAQSQVIIDRTMPRENIEHFGFSIYDQDGTSLGFEGGSGSSIIDLGNGMVNFKDTILLQGREEAPTGVIIEIYNNKGIPYDTANIKEVTIPLDEVKLPYTMDYPDGSKLIVTGFEQLEDKTILYYDIEGKLGLQSTFLMLEDENGERLAPVNMDGHRTSLETLSFSREYPKTEGPVSLFTTMEIKTTVETKQFEVKLK